MEKQGEEEAQIDPELSKYVTRLQKKIDQQTLVIRLLCITIVIMILFFWALSRPLD